MMSKSESSRLKLIRVLLNALSSVVALVAIQSKQREDVSREVDLLSLIKN